MHIRFQRAKEIDAAKLVEIQNKAFYEDYVKYGMCPGYNRSIESMIKSITTADTFKIIVDNMIVGDIIVSKKGEYEYYLGGICVIPEYENKGIGQKAMTFIDKYYEDAKVWTLETPADKIRNHYFYKKCGFEITDTIQDGDVAVVIFTKYIKKND